jgi:hypothetical protein
VRRARSPLQRRAEGGLDHLIDAAMAARHGGVAARLGAEFEPQAPLMRRPVDQMGARAGLERIGEIRCLGDRGEIRGEALAVACSDAGDQVFLGAEIDIGRARADPRRARDFGHSGGVEAGARDAALGGVEQSHASRRLLVG